MAKTDGVSQQLKIRVLKIALVGMLWMAQDSSAQTVTLLRTLSIGADASSVAFSRDGKTLASGGGQAVRIWDVGAGRLIRTLAQSDSVTAVAFSRDGKMLASGSMDTEIGGKVRLWDARSGRLLRSWTTQDLNGVESVAFSPNGSMLAGGGGAGEGGNVRLYDVRKGRFLWTRNGLAPAFSPDGKTLATGYGGMGGEGDSSDEGRVWLWDAQTGRSRRMLKAHFDSVGALSFSPDGKVLASGAPSFKRNAYGEWEEAGGEVKLWEPLTGKLKRTLRGHGGGVNSIAFSPDGKWLASGSTRYKGRTPYGELKLWDAQTGKLKCTLKSSRGGVTSIAFSPDSKLLAGTSGKVVQVWQFK